LNPQEKQKDNIQGTSSEGNVLKLVSGYLSELGLSSENISVEHRTITIHIFRNVKITIKGKSKPYASGRIDILVKNDTRENLFVIETKKPSESIDPETSMRQQRKKYGTFTPKEGDFITTIQILDSTRNRLKMSCRKDQTYDDKIRELLDLEDNK
jgi:hypothetical protein